VHGVEVDLTARHPRTIWTLIPILSWLPGYSWGRDTARDLVAGIALAALLIPESLGYAGLAGVPAELGLYAALAAIVAYAVTGGTSILVVGPASGVAALTASIIAELGGDADPAVLAAALAATSGLILLIAGILRAGWVVNFVSRPVLEAFVAGLSISIIIGQLDGLLLSLAFVVRRASFPEVVELGRTRDGRLVSTTTDPTGSQAVERAAVLRFDAPLIYANADRFTRAALALVERRPNIDRLVIDAEVIADLDATGAEHLGHLDRHLAERGISLRLARVHRRVRTQIERSHLGAQLKVRIYTDIEDALASLDGQP
jgi:MFS superfamily sulfate permease-like transporter